MIKSQKIIWCAERGSFPCLPVDKIAPRALFGAPLYLGAYNGR